MALIGTGWQAQGAAHCFAALGNLERIEVYSPTPGNKEKFAEQMSKEAGIEIVPAPSAREAVRGADIVYMATNSKDPVVMADWLEPGQFVSNVSDVELEIAGWERCDVLTMNRHGRRWMRYAIGGAEAIPEHGKDQYTRPTTIEWDKLPLSGRRHRRQPPRPHLRQPDHGPRPARRRRAVYRRRPPHLQSLQGEGIGDRDSKRTVLAGREVHTLIPGGSLRGHGGAAHATRWNFATETGLVSANPLR